MLVQEESFQIFDDSLFFRFDDHELFNDYVNGTNSNMEIYGQAIDGAWRNYLGQGNPSPNAPYYYNFNIGVGAFFVLVSFILF